MLIKAKKHILLYIFLIVGFVQVRAQDRKYYFETLDIHEGLSQNTVNTIIQDHFGFMWFGTKDGVNRYDGLDFRVFKQKIGDKNGLKSNFINVLFEDREHIIWVGTDAGLYLYNPQKESFTAFEYRTVDGTTIDKSITVIYGDQKGGIWIAVEEQGLFYFDLNKKSLIRYTLTQLNGGRANIQSFFIDNNGTIWIGFFKDGLSYSKDDLKTLRPFLTNGKEPFEGGIVNKIIEGAYNCLYVGTAKGIYEINLSSERLKSLIQTDEKGEELFVRDILPFSNNELWIGTESGVYIYNLRQHEYSHHYNILGDRYSLSDNAVYCLCKDKEGGVWIGTYFGGVNYLTQQYSYFKKYYPSHDSNSLHGMRIREFCKDNKGIIWIGTEDGGLNRFDPKTSQFHFFDPSKSFRNVHALCMDGDMLWVGTFAKGLKVIDTRTNKIVRSYYKGDKENTLNENSVFAICRTVSGNIWIGTLFGLHFYNRETDDFTRIPELEGKFIYDIKEDSHGNIWLATYANGIYKYEISQKRWKNYTYEGNQAGEIPNNKVVSIFEDSRSILWFTTQGGGFCRYNQNTDTFTTYNSNRGLPNDVVYQIIEDNDGMFWVTTNGGLVRFNPETEDMKIYTVADGLPVNQFNYRSGYKSIDGTIYLGSIEGFISFNPRDFGENKYIPPIVITDFSIFNKRAVVGEKNSPLNKSIILSDSIELASDQNSFSLRVAALGYQAPDRYIISYKLEGFDEEWYSRPSSGIITYSNLVYGNYTLKIRSEDADGLWHNEYTMLYIHILPPFYLSTWAYIFYIVFTIVVVLLAVYFIRKQNKIKQLRQIEDFERQKEREIYNAKIDFFTNIAHEIRTPLTLIKGPLDNILGKGEVTSTLKEDMDIMSQNTDRLLDLTNQLLDFRKAETLGFSLNFTRCNISEILRNTYHRFSSMVRQKELNFSIFLPEKDFFADVDKEAFTKILSNLFNNAVKYSDTYIYVWLLLESKSNIGYFSVRIQNDGMLIPAEKAEDIFKPFVQYNKNDTDKISSGTGIGLPLARSLAELHSGFLILETKSGCNSFCLSLPKEQKNIINISEPVTNDKEEIRENFGGAEKVSGHYTILIVEDNLEMQNFIVRQLSDRYTVLAASNGIEALEIMDNNYVHLIISDIVMPKMDGFELCKHLKSKINYSHIPVILLTAQTNLQSKITGIEVGADTYIEKPFSTEYLLTCVAGLLKNREKLREAFANSPFIAVNTVATSQPDEEFVRNLKEIIEANLSDPEFSMDDIAGTLNMSRSSFYRKIKGALDMTPNDYLRLERLKKAAQLLQEGKYRINEICYMVGFSSPSYFAKCFQKQFGVLPKDLMEKFQ